MSLWRLWNEEGPWGRGPNRGSSGSRGPDIEDILKKSQENFKRMMPKDQSPKGALGLGLLVVIGLWVASGFYQVKEGEQGAVYVLENGLKHQVLVLIFIFLILLRKLKL
jgi:membrane protease subunit HflK